MDRLIRVFASHAVAANAERAELAAASPQERLDRALDLHARYRETFGEAGQGSGTNCSNCFERTELSFSSSEGTPLPFHGHPRLTEDLDLFPCAPICRMGNGSWRRCRISAFGTLDLTPDDFVADDRVIQLGRAPNRVDSADETLRRRIRGRRGSVSAVAASARFHTSLDDRTG